MSHVPSCWITEYEYECGPDGELCHRGAPISEYINAATVSVVIVGSLTSVVLTVSLWRSYRRIIRCLAQLTYGSISEHSSSILGRLRPSQRFETTTRNDEYLAEATSQAIWYCVIYINQIFWMTTGFAIGSATNGEPVVFFFLLSAVYPLSGLFNAFVYVRPRYRSLRKQFKGLSRSHTLWYCVQDKTVDDISVIVRSPRPDSQTGDTRDRDDQEPSADGIVDNTPEPPQTVSYRMERDTETIEGGKTDNGVMNV